MLCFFTSRIPFLSLKRWCQSTEGSEPWKIKSESLNEIFEPNKSTNSPRRSAHFHDNDDDDSITGDLLLPTGLCIHFGFFLCLSVYLLLSRVDINETRQSLIPVELYRIDNSSLY